VLESRERSTIGTYLGDAMRTAQRCTPLRGGSQVERHMGRSNLYKSSQRSALKEASARVPV
jgi:hypothetical protein